MRLRIKFGIVDEKDVNWYQNVEQFPVVIKYLGRNYEWFVYDKDLTGQVDMILQFSELPTYDPNYGVLCPVWEDMFPESVSGCECGSTLKDPGHMFFCRLWRKV